MATKKRAASSQSAQSDAETVTRPDWRLGASLPWFLSARQSLMAAERAQRLPHALLLKGPPGIGKGAFAEWVARFALCEYAERSPCGVCHSCQLHAAGNHPDLRRTAPPPGKNQIPVDAIRQLIGDLALKSYRGARKVGIVDPADALNSAGANAFLKTLEEPGQGTLLLLVAHRIDRLPATIRSRCQQMALPGPTTAQATQWLETQGDAPWSGLLNLVNNAPLAALALVESGAADLPADMESLYQALRRGGPVDLIAAAEICHKEFPQLRLTWLESWATHRIYAAAGVAMDQDIKAFDLPVAASTPHIESLFALIDQTRAAMGHLRGSVNAQMVFEGVLATFARCVRSSVS